ncbi:MAG: PIN domain-containing protein [Candidatus Methylumidiphilus sp.]
MNSTKFLLDTNYILGLAKGQPDVIDNIKQRGADSRWYGFSSISRMESLGFTAITPEEEKVIASLLGKLRYFPITPKIAASTIILRSRCKLKLPDAVILATAHVHRLELLTLDEDLLKQHRQNRSLLAQLGRFLNQRII